MPHRRFWVAASTLFLLASAAMTTGQAQTGRNPGAAQGQIPPQILQRFDANGNGQLEPAEQQAAMQYMQQMQAGGGQPGAGKGMGGRGAGGQGLGGQGGGMMNPQMQQQLMQKFDANGNGQLDPDEQQAAAQFMQQMQQGGGQGMGGKGMGGRPGGGKGMGGRPGAGGMGAGGTGAGGMAGAMMNPQMQQQLMQKFDTNGNGQLDPNEQQAAAQYVQQMQQGGGQGMGGKGMGGRPGGGKGMGGRPGAGGMGAGGTGAGGMAGAMMNPQMQQQLMQKFDKNGNGQLDPDEQQAAAQYMQQMQAGGGPGMGGRPGGGKGMGGQPGAGGPGAGGPGAGGPAGAMTNPQVQQQLLQKFDKNKNGQLDPSEQQAAAQYVQQMQAGGGRANKNN